MRALVLHPDGTLMLRNLTKPSANDTNHECVIRVSAAGICGTDLELLRGYAGFAGIPGHEFVGIVEDAREADSAWIGRRVVGEITVGCGECAGCRAAGRGHCDHRTVLGIRGRNGAFAEYLSLPARNLHPLPDSLDDVTAVFVEPTAAACRIAEQVLIAPGVQTAVVGAGRLGLLVAQVLRAHGADVMVIARSENRQAAASGLHFEVASVERAMRSFGRHFDVVVDATGDPGGFTVATALVRPRGALVLKSTFHGETAVSFSSLVVDEIAVIGSRCGPFDAAIDLLAGGGVDVRPLVTGLFPLEHYSQAFEHARRAGSKVLMLPTAG